VTADARLAEVFAELEAAGLSCLVMGGHAVRYYGLARNTDDVDLQIAPRQWDDLAGTLARTKLFAGQAVTEGPSSAVGECADAEMAKCAGMFTQVYFDKTRVAFDHHLQRALTESVPGGRFPKPTGPELDAFLQWDDWRVLGALADGQGGEHGRSLATRNHYREVYHTPESPRHKDRAQLKRVRKCLSALLRSEGRADKSWYKVGNPDIPVVSDNPDRQVAPLSGYSPLVGRLRPIDKTMLFCDSADVEEARRRIQAVGR
jgi:hypothetical protein